MLTRQESMQYSEGEIVLYPQGSEGEVIMYGIPLLLSPPTRDSNNERAIVLREQNSLISEGIIYVFTY